MPRAKALTSYPNKKFGELYAYVSRTGEPLTIPLTKTKAATYRHELYAWARVVRASPEKAIDLGVNPLDLDDVRLTITEQGLMLSHKDKTEGMEAIDGVLASIGVIPAKAMPVPAAPVVDVENPFGTPDEIMARLMAQVKKGD